jgi:hypothetical protein
MIKKIQNKIQENKDKKQLGIDSVHNQSRNSELSADYKTLLAPKEERFITLVN